MFIPIERFFLENNFKVFVINHIYGKMHKRNIRSSWQNINLALLKYSISFAKLKMEKIQKNENEMIFISEIENEINLILEACKKFMKAINDTTSLIFTKKQLENWISDNIVLENNELNSKVTKI